jgi:hypothetical protein
MARNMAVSEFFSGSSCMFYNKSGAESASSLQEIPGFLKKAITRSLAGFYEMRRNQSGPPEYKDGKVLMMKLLLLSLLLIGPAFGSSDWYSSAEARRLRGEARRERMEMVRQNRREWAADRRERVANRLEAHRELRRANRESQFERAEARRERQRARIEDRRADRDSRRIRFF